MTPRIHKSASHIACPWCRAPRGSLCLGKLGPRAAVHDARVVAYRRLRAFLEAP